jgi:hypothetical protein
MTRLLPLFALFGVLVGCAPGPHYYSHSSGYRSYHRPYVAPTPVCQYNRVYDHRLRQMVTVRRCY